ncbi:MAG: fasciclin domain-containing protein [Sphingomonadaceae bacterium]
MKFAIGNRLALAAALGSLTMLPACSASNKETAAQASGEMTVKKDSTLTDVLGNQSELSTLAKAVKESELDSVFDGKASYTLLAPDNDAFAKLGDKAATLMSADQRPVLIALLRQHLLPGFVAPEDISKAIASKGGPVTMTTLGGTDVTFSKQGDTIMVANGDGSKASFVGNATGANNGVVIPLDAVLVPGDKAS